MKNEFLNPVVSNQSEVFSLTVKGCAASPEATNSSAGALKVALNTDFSIKRLFISQPGL